VARLFANLLTVTATHFIPFAKRSSLMFRVCGLLGARTRTKRLSLDEYHCREPKANPKFLQVVVVVGGACYGA
jgi:hypothetical protein